MYDDTTIIVPTLNEEQNIKELILRLTELYPKIRIIVSDDGSRDCTKQIVTELSKKNKGIVFLDRTQSKAHGLTVSVLDALQRVKTEKFVVMDADLQHPPEKVKELIEKLNQGDLLVVAVREKVMGGWPFSRKVISKTATMLGKLRLLLNGTSCSDPLSGFFAGRTKLFQQLSFKKERFQLQGYKVLFDFLKIVPARIKMAEVKYEFNSRRKGSSKIRVKHILLYFKSLF